jgi:hypothetical protein
VDQVGEECRARCRDEDRGLQDRGQEQHDEAEHDGAQAVTGARDGAVDEAVAVTVTAAGVATAMPVPRAVVVRVLAVRCD